MTGAAAGLGIAIQVGAVTIYLVLLSATAPRRVAAAAALGVASVDGIYSGLAVAAGAAASRVIVPILDPLRWVACAVLLWTAVWIVVDAFRGASGAARSFAPGGGRVTPLRAYLQMAGITVLNPGTVVYFVAVVIGGHFDALGVTDRVAFTLAAFAASAGWQLVVVTVGSAAGGVLTGRAGRRATAAAGAVLIAALAVSTVW